MRIDTSGNVGIGTTSPSGLLTVVAGGGGTMGGTSDNRTEVFNEVIWDNLPSNYQYTSQPNELVIENNAQGAGMWAGIIFGAGYKIGGASVATARVAAVREDDTTGNTSLIFSTRGGTYEKMRLTSGGRLGLLTDDPQATLHVNGGGVFGSTSLVGLGTGTVNVSGNYYINGIPISTFVDVPDAQIYARTQGSWVLLGTGVGTVSDLSLINRTSTTNEIGNTGGDNVVLLEATDSVAGLMTVDQVDKLGSVDTGANNYTHPTYTSRSINTSGAQVLDILTSNSIGSVTAASIRTMTLTDLGYTGDPDANDYVHPTYSGDDFDVNTNPLTGAWVVSEIDMNMTSDGEGHVTDANGFVGTRQLTAADIGAASESDISVTSPAGDIQINSGVETLTIPGSNASGTVIRTTVGQMVFLSGRISWTSRTSSSSQILIQGLTYSSDYATGVVGAQKNLRVTNSQRNGLSMELEAGASQFALYWMIGESDRITAKYQDMQTTGHIDINIQYFSSDVPQV